MKCNTFVRVDKDGKELENFIPVKASYGVDKIDCEVYLGGVKIIGLDDTNISGGLYSEQIKELEDSCLADYKQSICDDAHSNKGIS